MVTSIINKIVTIPLWFKYSSWPCGDNLFTLRGLLHNPAREFCTFENVRSFRGRVIILLSLGSSVYINVITNILTGDVFKELRIAYQSGARVHIH